MPTLKDQGVLRGQMPKPLTRKQLAEIKRDTKAFHKRQKEDQWYETFRQVFIACGDLRNPDDIFNETYKQQLTRREHTCRLIADRIESLRPKQAGYQTVLPYAGK